MRAYLFSRCAIKMTALEIYPLPVLIIDYVFGMIMWTLIGRAVLDLFIASDSNMVIAKVFRQITNPVIRLFNRITPAFLAPVLIPIYVAWWFYMVRFYIIPLIFVGELGLLSFPLESEIARIFKF